jgi:Calpain family cysteine protease/Bacterial pre-peptidase C-terminal domain
MMLSTLTKTKSPLDPLLKSAKQPQISTLGASIADSIIPTPRLYQRGLSRASSTSRASLPHNARPFEAGNTTTTAYSLGTLFDKPKKLYDAIYLSDVDVYSFQLNTRKTFNLALSDVFPKKSLTVQLLGSDGNSVLASSLRTGNLDAAINYALEAGTYYIKVTSDARSITAYSLRVSATPIASPSNLLAIEADIGQLNKSVRFGDRVDSTDTTDGFRFMVSKPKTLSVLTDGVGSDLSLRVVRDRNGNGIVDGEDEVARSTRGNAISEWLTQSLSPGSYFAQVYQASGSSDYSLRLFPTQDAKLSSTLKTAASDYQLTRNEMIDLLRGAKDGDTISSEELDDLRVIVSEVEPFMPEYVHNLANKTVNGDRANQWWTSGNSTSESLGNLSAGASANHMEKLIGKWFFGLDHPTADWGTNYNYVQGSLVQSGFSAEDVRQGALGDCGYMTTLVSAAVEKPQLLQTMFIDNGDNTYTVRFYNNGTPDYVTVDRYLPNTSDGYRYYASWGNHYSDSSNELWVALAEKAAVQWSESGAIGQGVNAYNSIYGLYSLGMVSGLPTTWKSYNELTKQELIDLSNSNKMLTANVHTNDYGFVRAHAYCITNYNPSTGMFHFNNPWGSSHVDVMWDQLQSINGWIGIDWTLS